MDSPDISVLQTQLTNIVDRLEAGFSDMKEALAQIRSDSNAVEERVRQLELRASRDQVESIHERIQHLINKLMALEVDTAVERTKMKWLLAGIGFIASIAGSVITFFLK